MATIKNKSVMKLFEIFYMHAGSSRRGLSRKGLDDAFVNKSLVPDPGYCILLYFSKNMGDVGGEQHQLVKIKHI